MRWALSRSADRPSSFELRTSNFGLRIGPSGARRSKIEDRSNRWLTLSTPIVIAVFLVTGCSRQPDLKSVPPEIVEAKGASTGQASLIPHVRFTDITSQAGIHFKHTNGAFGKKMLPETMGSGVAFLDYDKDGHPDLLFVNSCYWPGHEQATGDAPCLTLYRNQGNGTFEDVTAASGLAITMYGMGVTVGDYDNDGWQDIFVSGVGGNRLFHNVSDGHGGRRFEDVTQRAGVAGTGHWPSPSEGEFLNVKTPISFPSSAAFLDYDGDGKLDIFVCHYITWSPFLDLSQPFTLEGVGRGFGPPNSFEGAQCRLYHNLGDGRFEDVSAKAGIEVFDQEGVGDKARQRSIGKSLGVYVCDVDNDGWPDIIVANDTVRNFFFHNMGDGTFKEDALLYGMAYAEGKARGAMGIDGCEYRAGRFAVALANFADEPVTFLRCDMARSADRATMAEQLLFFDAAVAEGVAGASRIPLKFGTFFFDYDLDGRPDLLICNGHLEPEISKVQKGQSYEQSALLFWNCGGKCSFVPVTEEQAGPDLFKPLVGRGSAFADIDGDGYLDVVLTANGGPARLLRNNGGTRNHWIRLSLEGDGVHSNRSAIGAKVILKAAGKTQYQQVTSARGYLSQSELPVTFGLGTADKVDSITVLWPGRNAGKQEWKGLTVDKMHILKQR
jgi:enediyne biosynthesis protein E4